MHLFLAIFLQGPAANEVTSTTVLIEDLCTTDTSIDSEQHPKTSTKRMERYRWRCSYNHM
jgi:hypothetical protein